MKATNTIHARTRRGEQKPYGKEKRKRQLRGCGEGENEEKES
jgi:hypothetical protein